FLNDLAYVGWSADSFVCGRITRTWGSEGGTAAHQQQQTTAGKRTVWHEIPAQLRAGGYLLCLEHGFRRDMYVDTGKIVEVGRNLHVLHRPGYLRVDSQL